MSEPLRALIVEDSEDDARLVLRELRRAGYEPIFERVESADAMRAALAARAWDLILCDYVVPGFGGLEALEIAKESGLDLPFILLSNKVSEETLVEAMRAGATDFLMKDRLERLGPVVKRELVDAAARRGLRLAQIQWETAFDAVQDALFIHDVEGRIMRANLAYAALGGLPTREIIGKLYWEVFPKADGPLASCATEIKTLNWTQEEIGLPAGATYESRSYPILDAKGAYLYSLHVLQDITERKQGEHRRLLEAKRLEVSLTLSKMIDQSEQAILDFVLEQCIGISASRYAFIGRLDADESVMTVHAFSKDAMARCAVQSAPPVFALADAGLWAEPVRQRRSVFINDCTVPHQHRHGTPAGHVELKRYLGVPVFERDHIVMLIAVANKESDYTQSDAERLSSLATDAWRVIERQRAENALLRSNRALRTLSAGNEALVRATDETELLDTVCQLIVKQGGYRMAWVGYADDNAERSITPRAWAGTGQVELDSLKLSWADTERGQGPMSRAIRTGEPQLTRDILSDPGFELWREQASAHGFVSVFACPLWVGERIIGSLGIYAAEADVFVGEELDLMKELASDLAYGIETLRTRRDRDRLADAQVRDAERLQKSLEQSIQTIADTVEARDPYTAGHQRRVGELAVAIARELGLAQETIHGIRLAAAVHDLGKIHLPAEILSKPGKLSAIEFMLIQTHPQAGYEILKNVDFPWPIADIVHQHHERMDGSGYPQGLKGDEILLESRILAVADVVEAMASHRPYREALGIDAALKEIEAGRGTAFDATVVDACIRLFSEKRFVFSS